MIPGWLARPLPPFPHVSLLYKIRSFGLDYVVLHLGEEGTLYVTRHGWPLLEQLLPAAWYTDQKYASIGRRMSVATGTVYRVPAEAAGKTADLLIKFSRVGQEVPIWIEPSAEAHITQQDIANARFVGPFEEFGLCEEIRQGAFGPPQLHIRTKSPLAIYVPPRRYQPWQLGRQDSDFDISNNTQAEDPTHLGGAAVHLDKDLDYVLVYGWLHGDDAQVCYSRGEISREEFESLTPMVVAELEAKGFLMLDVKPLHFILRKRHQRRSSRTGEAAGDFLRRNGQLVYALIDYELVVRTQPHRRWFQEQLNASLGDCP